MSTTKIRASSWSRLFDCAHAFEWVHILGHRSHGSPRSLLGTAIHAGTAVFDTARMQGSPISPADAAGVLVEKLHNPDEPISWASWAGGDLSQRDAEKIGISLLTKYCREWSPRFEFRAVEMETKPLVIDCGGGTLIELTGTMDRSRSIIVSDRTRVGDLKSGRAAVQKGVAVTKGHAAQLGTYIILYEHTTGEVVDDTCEIIGLSTSGNGQIATGQIAGAKQMLIGTEEEPGLIAFAKVMLAAGSFPPNPSSRLCDKKFCPRWNHCRFHN